jgi:hypothetical protein
MASLADFVLKVDPVESVLYLQAETKLLSFSAFFI